MSHVENRVEIKIRRNVIIDQEKLVRDNIQANEMFLENRGKRPLSKNKTKKIIKTLTNDQEVLLELAKIEMITLQKYEVFSLKGLIYEV